MKVRQDAWSHEDDLLLAETVLRYIRDGGTQLAAFEEVGDALNRTSAACGFRWNAEVRRKYELAIAIAKKQRKEKKRAFEKQKKELVEQKEMPAPSKEMEWLPPTAANTEWEELTPLQEEENMESYPAIPMSSNQITLNDCIHFLQNLQRDQHSAQGKQIENERLNRENQLFKEKNKALEDQLRKLEEQQNIITEDYEMLVQIMDRARKMTTMQDEVM